MTGARRWVNDIASRATARPLRQRFYQTVNAGIVAVAGARLGVVHLAEHPKSGGSWVRNMLQRYLGGPRYMGNRIVGRRTVIQLFRLSRPMYCNPVVLYRDPRDIFVSFYYHELRDAEGLPSPHFRHDPNRDLRDDFALYLEAKLLHPAHPRYRFGDFYESWSSTDACPVRYEDFLTAPEDQLKKIVTHLGEVPDLERISEAVDHYSFAKSSARRTGTARRPGQTDHQQFERKGVAGDWRNHFNARSCELMFRYEQRALVALGYEGDSNWVERFLASKDGESD